MIRTRGCSSSACHPWLLAEIDAVRPDVIVCLGATAAQALLGPAFRVTKQRGEPLPFASGRRIVATVHPSAILRAPDPETRHRELRRFISDLAVARDLLSSGAAAQPSAPQP